MRSSPLTRARRRRHSAGRVTVLCAALLLCIGATLADAGLTVLPYHVDVPSFGDWGFFLAARKTDVANGAGGADGDSSPTTGSVPFKSSRATVRRFSYRRRR